jgi:hypothetical protein
LSGHPTPTRICEWDEGSFMGGSLPSRWGGRLFFLLFFMNRRTVLSALGTKATSRGESPLFHCRRTPWQHRTNSALLTKAASAQEGTRVVLSSARRVMLARTPSSTAVREGHHHLRAQRNVCTNPGSSGKDGRCPDGDLAGH